jgi:small subunit ribosomal protein S13
MPEDKEPKQKTEQKVKQGKEQKVKQGKEQKVKQGKEQKVKKQEKPKEYKGKRREKILAEALVRIMATDIPSNMKLYAGLTKIKGVSWSFSNVICQMLKIDKNKKMVELTEAEIKKITDFIKNPDPSIPPWLFNRRKDRETGEDKHLATTELDLQKEFDIRAMRKMRSYKGVRHSMGQPVRGQRTRGHFRSGKAIGVQRTKVTKKR